jgi:hypothetical protein
MNHICKMNLEAEQATENHVHYSLPFAVYHIILEEGATDLF